MPRIRIEPLGCEITDGPDATALSEAYSFTLDPWQADVLNCWTARDPVDGPLYTTCGISCPRQNGKNGILEAYEAYKLLICGEMILHTAHQVKTANKSFQKLAALMTNPAHPEVNSEVEKIRYTNGEQAIYLKNGGFIEYSARSRGASRGNTYSIVVYDEAQELTDEQAEALMSTISATPTGYRQLLYTGTPPGPNSPGTVFPRIRESAQSGKSKRTCWHEWSITECPLPGTKFVDLIDDCYETNPALGIRLDLDFTEDEFATMSIDGFARERLGWWSEHSNAALINTKSWAKLKTSEPPENGKLAYGVKFRVDGGTVALAVCLVPSEGDPHVELIELRNMNDGVTWLADWLIERWHNAAVIVIDGRAGADELIAQLIKGGVSKRAIVRCGTSTMIEATTRFYTAVKESRITHYNQELLNDAVGHARKRPIGHEGGFGWGQIDDTDVSPLEAVTLAYWGAVTSKRNPGRKAKIL